MKSSADVAVPITPHPRRNVGLGHSTPRFDVICYSIRTLPCFTYQQGPSDRWTRRKDQRSRRGECGWGRWVVERFCEELEWSG